MDWKPLTPEEEVLREGEGVPGTVEEAEVEKLPTLAPSWMTGPMMLIGPMRNRLREPVISRDSKGEPMGAGMPARPARRDSGLVMAR